MDVSSGGGTVTIGNETASKDSPFSQSFAEATTVTMTAVPDEGYEFEYYDVNGTRRDTPSLELYVNCAITVEARFKSLTPDSGDNNDDGSGGCFIRSSAH